MQGRKTPSLQTPEAVPGGTLGAPCQCYLALCPIGAFAPGGGGGGWRLSKEMGVMSESYPSASSSESWSFPKNLDGAGSLACVNYTVLCVCAQPARMYILGEKPVLVVQLVIPPTSRKHTTGPNGLGTQWVYSGGNWGQACADPSLGAQESGVQDHGDISGLGIWRGGFSALGPPNPSLCPLPRPPACLQTVLRVSSIPPSSSHCPLCTNHLGKTQWSDPNFRKPPRGHN